MTRARDVSRLITTPPNIYATDTETSSAGYLTNASASSTYLSQSSASTTYAPVAAGGLVQMIPTSITNTNGTASVSSKGLVTFSGVSTLSLNGVFTSTYKVYKIFWLGRHTANTGCLMRLRASGTDSSAADTSYAATYSNGSAGPSRYIQGLNSAFETGAAWDQYNQREITLSNPTDTTYEKMFFLTWASRNSVNGYEGGVYAGWKASTTSFDGFSLIPSSGTMLGQISVYGIRE
jgi:hypothetical protein